MKSNFRDIFSATYSDTLGYLYSVSLFLFFISGVNLLAQNDGAGNTGLAFLKLGVTSRALSLGEAVTACNEDASATHYNPASLTNGNKSGLLFMHSENILGIRTEYLAAKIRLEKLTFGLQLNNTSVSNIEYREIPGEPESRFDAQNFAAGLSCAYKFSNELSLGAGIKFLYEKIFVDNASGFAFDFGATYQTGDILIGAVISNIGSMNELKSESTKLPLSLRAGSSYLYELPKLNADLRLGLDVYKVINGGTFHINSGAEFIYNDFLSIRAGYQSGYENRNFTTGIGLVYKSFTLDYAFIPYKYSLGSNHNITLGASF